MADNSAIEWTDATWNPVTGCTKIGLGSVGLVSALTARGDTTKEIMLAGNCKSARMVAHYSAAAIAKKGAVARLGRWSNTKPGHSLNGNPVSALPCRRQ